MEEKKPALLASGECSRPALSSPVSPCHCPVPSSKPRGLTPPCHGQKRGPTVPASCQQDRAPTVSPPLVPGQGAALLSWDLSSSLDIYSIARNEREEAADNMFPALCFVQIPSRQHVCVCEGLRVLLSAASKQGSSKFSKAYSPPSNTALALETVHGFDTPVGFLPTSLCQRFLGVSGRLHLDFAGEKRSRLHHAWDRAAPHR